MLCLQNEPLSIARMHGVARSGMVLSEVPDAEAIAMKWQMVGLPANPFDLLEQYRVRKKDARRWCGSWWNRR
jgi:hypothetical protein